jgi:type II secretory pathway component PulF
MFGFHTKPLALRAHFYHLLGHCLDSGIAVSQALQTALGPTPPPGWKDVVAALSEGEGVANSLRRAAIPESEYRSLAAGEQSGRLVEALTQLSKDLEAELQARKELARRLAYPALVIHLVPVALSTPYLILDPLRFVLNLLLSWGALWGIVALGYGLHRVFRDRSSYQRTVRQIPAVGSVWRAWIQRAFCRQLSWMYGAGVPLRECLPQASSNAANSPWAAEFQQAAALARKGESMDHCLAVLHSLPQLLRQELCTASTTGHLEEALRRVADQLQETYQQKTSALVRTLGFTLYLLAMAAVAWSVVSFYGGYFAQLGSV